MSKTSRTMSFNAQLTSTREKYYKNGVPQDAIFNAIPTLEALRRKKAFRENMDGGEVIRINLIESKNSNGKWYAGYEPANTTPQDEFTIAYEQWRQGSWTTPISGIEVFKNGGEKIFDLLAQKEEVTYMSATEDTNQVLYDVAGLTIGTGATSFGGKAPNSIPNLVKKDISTSQIVHGITSSSSANTWWLNRSKDGSGFTTPQKFIDGIRHEVNTANRGRGGGMVDLIAADQVSYELFESALDTKVQYTTTKTATAGFETVTWKGVEWIWDVYVPDANAGTNGGPDTTLTNGTIYLLNSGCLKFAVGKGKDFSPTPFVDGTYNGQDAKLSMTLLYCQLFTASRRNLGVIYKLPLAFS